MPKNKLTKRIVLFLTVLLMIITFNTNIYAAVPAINDSGASVYLYQDTTDSCVFSQNGEKKIYPASTTKIMTAVVTLATIKDLTKEVIVGNELNWTPAGSSTAGLLKGEKFQYRDLLYALMLPSGNDAAIVLACNVGKEISGRSDITKKEAYKVFVEKMNETAKKIGMENTHYMNPHGFHNKKHYTTAKDMTKLAAYADNFDYYNRVVDSTFYQTRSNKKSHLWNNTNRIILKTSNYFYSLAKGDKTGYTNPAGYCLVTSSEDSDGNKFYVAVMHASIRSKSFEIGKKLLEYANTKTKQFHLTDANTKLFEYEVSNKGLGQTGELKVVNNKAIDVYADKSCKTEDFSLKFEPDSKYLTKSDDGYELTKSIKKGDNIGKIIICKNGKAYGSVKAYAKSDVRMLTKRDRLIRMALIGIAAFCVIFMGVNFSVKHRLKKHNTVYVDEDGNIINDNE